MFTMFNPITNVEITGVTLSYVKQWESLGFVIKSYYNTNVIPISIAINNLLN